MPVSVALLSRAPFAGTAFFYLWICLSVHAFTDLHLGNTARSFHASLPLLYCISILVVPPFSFARSSLFVSFFAARILDPYLSIKTLFKSKFPKALLLPLYSPSMRRLAFLLGYFFHFREASLTFSPLPVYLE